MTEQAKGRLGDAALAGLIKNPRARDLLRLRGHFHVECRDKDGNLKWTDDSYNRIVDQGLTYLIGVALLSTTQILLTSWYVGLTDSTPTVAAGDTLASHAGWVEETGYTGTRKAWAGVAGSAGAASNSASPASFAITGTATIGGCFLCSVTSGTSGTLFSGVAFTGGDRSVVNTDTLNVTYNLSVADDAV